MSTSKIKIEFHPHRISHSRSRQKFSPYKNKQRKKENDIVSKENYRKIQLSEPLTYQSFKNRKFRKLIDPSITKTRLKLNLDDQRARQQTIPNNIEYYTNVECTNCIKLMNKIDEQTILLKQNFKEINKNIRLPKIIGKSDTHEAHQQKIQYSENQKIIMHCLNELKIRQDEAMILQNSKRLYEEQLTLMKKQIYEWEARYRLLEVELMDFKLDQQKSRKGKVQLSSRIFKDACTSSVFIEQNTISESKLQLFNKFKCQPTIVENKNQMKILLSDMIEKQHTDFQKIMSQLKEIKFQNLMLRQEINLLNYALNQKDIKIQNLKKEFVSFAKNKQELPSPKQMEKSDKSNSNKLNLSINWNAQNMSQRDSFTTKRTKSIIMSSNNYISSSSLESQKNIKENKKQKQLKGERSKGKTSSNYLAPKKNRKYSQDQQNLLMKKSFLRLNKPDSIISKVEKQQLKKQKKELQYFSDQKMDSFDLIRRTLTYRFKGFKCNFEEIQSQILQRQNNKLSLSQINQILSEYPFSLGKKLRKSVQSFIVMKSQQNKQEYVYVFCDHFCNKLRQMVEDFNDLDDEEQFGFIENIKKKIYMCQQGIMKQCNALADSKGFITEANMEKILAHFKLSQVEIRIIISQCCLLSIDADHLDYKQYLSIFQNQQ